MFKNTLLAAWIIGMGLAPAASTYSELISGDLSNSSTSPKVLDFSPGSNIIGGNMGRGLTLDPDFFSFTVEAGESITSLSLLTYLPNRSAVAGSFFAIALGNTISSGDGTTHAANQLIGTTLVELLNAQNLLGTKYSGGASTLTNPLGPGIYTAWFQETATTVDYQLQFTMIPEPTSAVLGIFTLGLLLRRKR